MKTTILSVLSAMFVGISTSYATDLPSPKAFISDVIDQNKVSADQTALKINQLSELGYQEVQSAHTLSNHLAQQGFTVKSGVANIPTAFVASYGSGKPVIGFIAEFDALPGFSQQATAQRKTIEHQHNGQACGHHLLGTAAAEAAIAVKAYMDKHNIEGTLKVFGSPAEEGGGGKVYLSRAGLIQGVDVVLNWHPASFNDSNPINNLANFSGKFRFKGRSAHAAAAPELGRSALDAVESMNFMVNAMREHVDQGSRIHYVITNGGKAPNVVPDFAEVYYYARHNNPEIARQTWERIENAAKGAALGTETQVEIEITNATFSLLPNHLLSKLVHDNLTLVGGVTYDQDEVKFAEELQQSFNYEVPSVKSANDINPYDASGEIYYVSSDVGDISWNAPTNWLNVATWVPGTAPHSWQAVAAGSMSIGLKGMNVAAKTMAFSALDLLLDDKKVDAIYAEFVKARGEDFHYQPLVKDRAPPLDYRK